jgi:aryl-alcohol dehydrogenase-like predicted oxidoreductase
VGDLVVNRLGFGAMRLTGDLFGAGAPSDRGQSVAVLRRAVELGVNHVDTAAFYFSPLRSANELINTALAPYPDDLLIATKVGPWRDTWGEWQGMARPDQLRGQVEENLRQLGRDHLDLVTLRTLSVAAPVGDHVAALAALRDAGLVRFLGLSNVTVGQIDEALAIAPVATVQNRYSIDSRRPEADDVLRACAERGIAFVPYFAIAGDGREGGRRAGEPEPVLAVARAHGATAAQVRLAWTLAQGNHVLGIPGTSSLAHLAENVAAGALRLTGADLALLGSLA